MIRSNKTVNAGAAGEDYAVKVNEDTEHIPIVQQVQGSEAPEHLKLTTTDGNAVQDNFDVLTSGGVKDVFISNQSAAALYITWGTAAVVATDDHHYIPANGTLKLRDVGYTHFSIIRASGTDVTVSITGVG